jgi:hypothetical protein
MSSRLWCGALLASLLLTGCADNGPSLASRTATALQLASSRGWAESRLHAKGFDLALFKPAVLVDQQQLTIYIEGDGLAFLSPDVISADPTPLQPIALELALAAPLDPNGNVVYLARACQYTGTVGGCRPEYWTTKRFAPEVIAAMDDAVSSIKASSGATRLTLVGYSGGATVAALLAERRHDVVRLVSVAGNLSTRRWIELHGLAPLSGSLDPYDERGLLAGISQWHFVGSSDSVVPARLTEQFAAGMQHAKVIPIAGFDHVCCWVERWPDLWNSIGQ